MYAVILAGGSGTRLWPWSREQFPKQLISIYEKSLFQETVLRLGGLISYEDIIVVTNKAQKDPMAMQFKEIAGGKQALFIDEPFGRNTAPAIGLAAFYLYKIDPGVVMAVLPSDHHIELKDRYLDVLRKAEAAARKYGLVTFGIKPDRPETGYGYIYCGEQLNDYTYKVDRFVEKPDLKKAREYIKDSRFLWNSGMFVFKVEKLIEEFKQHLPKMYELLDKVNYDTFENLEEIYGQIEGTSIDYGIMEKSGKVVVIPADIKWSDIGSWEALYNMLSKDKDGNHIKGNVHSFDTFNSLILGERRVIGTVGVKDLFVVDTGDALMVCSKDGAQGVKKIVENLKQENAEEALFHRTIHRPWGSYTVLEEGAGYKIKRITVKPGARLSLQYHNRRSEHWVVVTGLARVTVDQKIMDLEKNESVYIPAKSLHRMENTGDTLMEIIEVQNGNYLGEDDIVRVADDYNRAEDSSIEEPWMESYLTWLKSPALDQETRAELEVILDDREIKDRFWKELEFGTGGFRGIIGAGTNRMNKYVVGRATQGLANFIIKDQDIKEKSVVIAYDTRHKSREFAEEAALVLAGNGIKACLFEDIRPTPVLSYAIGKLKAAAGIVITASHNPAQYNGYKVYWSDGGQITDNRAGEITEEIKIVDLFTGVKAISKEDALEKGLLVLIGEEIDGDYLEAVKSLSLYRGEQRNNLTIVYTPLHGTGNLPVRRVLKSLGYEKVYLVDQQLQPDGDFPTVKYPNPEESEAYELAITLGKKVDADIILGTDPDCDRVGCVVRDECGKYIVLTGNQAGALLTDFILSQLKANDELPPNGVLVKTIVTSELGEVIADDYGVDTINTLTGFKYIGEKIKEFEEAGDRKFIFGYEESFGYLAGTFVRDKDGVIAAMLIAEMAAFYKEQGLSLCQALQQLYGKYGHYKEDLASMIFEGPEGMNQIELLMERFRQEPPRELAGKKVVELRDYQKGQGFNLSEQKCFDLDLPQSDVLYYTLDDRSWFCIRPSGTEPKIKFYFSVNGESQEEVDLKLEELSTTVLDIAREAAVDEAASTDSVKKEKGRHA